MASPLFLFLFLLLVSAPRPSAAQLPTSTRLHFFLHEIFAAGDPGATNVAAAGGDDPSAFGYVGVYDDVLREGPDAGSMPIGRAQGLSAEASSLAGHVAFLTIFSLVFTGGELNGSSLAVAGRSVVEGAAITSERSIVGGTGIFQSATGYLVSRPLTAPAGRFLLEFDAYILHH
ncbi:dirigent protein 2-like [Curcuma longa]|uniref:dirigent protein 2-like n=1 Tax=Curcuma longa TaxID=136217 RepID=UPI003D9EC0B4